MTSALPQPAATYWWIVLDHDGVVHGLYLTKGEAMKDAPLRHTLVRLMEMNRIVCDPVPYKSKKWAAAGEQKP